jgi:hypothetical protein
VSFFLTLLSEKFKKLQTALIANGIFFLIVIEKLPFLYYFLVFGKAKKKKKKKKINKKIKKCGWVLFPFVFLFCVPWCRRRVSCSCFVSPGVAVVFRVPVLCPLVSPSCFVFLFCVPWCRRRVSCSCFVSLGVAVAFRVRMAGAQVCRISTRAHGQIFRKSPGSAPWPRSPGFGILAQRSHGLVVFSFLVLFWFLT